MTSRLNAGASLVSVLTPSYNQARWLPDNLASVSAQDYPSVEHIVMDGGSTDGSIEVLASATDPRLRWRSESDNGQSDALNRAFAASSGEIIGWLNSDDAYFGLDAISVAVDAFERHPDADVVYGHAALVGADGRILQVLWTPPEAARLMRFHDFLWQPAVFLRRRAFGKTMVDPRFQFMMDWELWLRLARRRAFVHVNRILAIDRHQPARKVITRKDLARADLALLRSEYRLANGPLAAIARKPAKVACRLLGLLHVREVATARLAFAGRVDGVTSLIKRQLARPRSRMPFEG